jgi:hypothetical protein
LFALLVVPLFCGGLYVREFMAVDAALDSGASYDYATDRADHVATTHPYIPFSDRHGALVIVSGVSLVAALLYGCFIMSTRRRTRAT